jgi:hypothetical protein
MGLTSSIIWAGHCQTWPYERKFSLVFIHPNAHHTPFCLLFCTVC